MTSRKLLNTKNILLGLAVATVLGCLIVFTPQIYSTASTKDQIFVKDGVPYNRIGLLFGSGLDHHHEPSDFLKERLDYATDLLKDDKIDIILLSGDNRFLNYNEPDAMKLYLLNAGVKESAIALDYGGRSTYDSCYRARHIFGVETATLITHTYHLPRATHTCSNIGIKTVGTGPVSSNRNYKLREIPSSLKAYIQIYITHPEAGVLGDPEHI